MHSGKITPTPHTHIWLGPARSFARTQFTQQFAHTLIEAHLYPQNGLPNRFTLPALLYPVLYYTMVCPHAHRGTPIPTVFMGITTHA